MSDRFTQGCSHRAPGHHLGVISAKHDFDAPVSASTPSTIEPRATPVGARRRSTIDLFERVSPAVVQESRVRRARPSHPRAKAVESQSGTAS